MYAVLVIEDETTLREGLIRLLGLEGYDVVGASDGPEGVALARQLQPDVILCDIMLPGLDGFEVLQQLHLDPATAHIPFIVLTARAEKPTAQRALELDATAYLTKPFELETLLETLSQAIAKRPQ